MKLQNTARSVITGKHLYLMLLGHADEIKRRRFYDTRTWAIRTSKITPENIQFIKFYA